MIYLDHAATTPLRKEAFNVMLPYLQSMQLTLTRFMPKGERLDQRSIRQEDKLLMQSMQNQVKSILQAADQNPITGRYLALCAHWKEKPHHHNAN